MVVPARSLHVLVAEDNRTNQKVIRKLLEHAGHRVTMVATGQEAVEALEEPAFDLVLMDLNMPELGGIDAVKLLRFTHDLGELPPIVALSADVDAADARGLPERRVLGLPDQAHRLPTPATDHGGTHRQPTRRPDGTGRQTVAPPSRRRRRRRRRIRDRPPSTCGRLASLAELDRGDGFLDGLIDDFVADLDTIVVQLEESAAERAMRAPFATTRMRCAAVPRMSAPSPCSTFA